MAVSQGMGGVHFGPFPLDNNCLSPEVENHSFQVLLATSIFFSGPSYNQHFKESSVYSDLPVTFCQIFQFTFEVFKDNRAA